MPNHRLRPLLLAPPSLFLAVIAIACDGDDRGRYDVTVTFNERYVESSGDAVAALLLAYDDGAEIARQPAPPLIRATLRSRRIDVCEALLGALAARTDVANLDCRTDRTPAPS